MIVKSLTLAVAVAATFLATTATSVTPARAGDPGAAVAAGAVGLVGGMILGGALADSARAEPAEEEVIVRRPPPRRVYVEEEVVQPRRCWREEWHDRWGDIHFRRVCR
jgi:hypothetical protein